MNKEIKYVSPFKRLCITVGNLPTAYIESMSYYEGLTFLVNYLANNVIPALNNNGEAVKELQEKYVELKQYVDEYFENLDVQEEINNKLDEMADSGQLTDIIAQYLGLAGMITFDTVADMKIAENLVDGSKCTTLGYHSVNDGGNSIYKIRKVLNTDTVNEMNLISLNDVTLVAELIAYDTINLNQLGSYGNGTDDDTTFIEEALNKYNIINFNKGTYLINSTISISNKNNKIINGNNCTLKINGLFKGIDFDTCENININNLNLTSPDQYNASPTNVNRDIMINLLNCKNININNNEISYGTTGITFDSCENIKFNNNILHDFKGWGCIFGYNITKCYNTYITNNISYNSVYDGIKLTGYIENIVIKNNTCHNNTRDGIDFAGHTAKNIIISKNNLYDNTICGIEFKLLDRNTYPFDTSFTKQFEDIMINENLITNNGDNGINSQLIYSDVNINNYQIYDNQIIMSSTSNNSNGGVRIAPAILSNMGDIKIYRNTIDAISKNLSCIRLSNVNNIMIYDNILLNGFTSSIYIDYQNTLYTDYGAGLSDINIENNIITVNGNANANAIRFVDTSSPINIHIINNKMKNVKSTAYIISNTTMGTGFCFIGNTEYDTYYDSIPTGRSFKGMIYLASDPITSGCIGWIANNTASSATYIPYIPLS